MEAINKLIINLMVISNFAKDIHYNCKGANFYGNHLFSDKIQENINEYIDQSKEVCLLGRGNKTLNSSEYLKKASEKIPNDISFENMRKLIINTLDEIEKMDGFSKGDENLIGAIAQDLQNNLGLINIMLGELKNV